MADKEDKGGGDNLANATIAFVLFLTILFLAFGDKVSNSNWFQNFTSGDKELSPSELFPSGDLALDRDALTKGETAVRSEPGGSLLGYQESRVIGRIVGGPVESFGSIWWRVNFDEAPSGWVEQKHLTTNTIAYKSVSIFSIVYDMWKPFGWTFSAIFFLLLMYVAMKESELQQFLYRRREATDAPARVRQQLPKVEPVVPGLPYIPAHKEGEPALGVMAADPDDLIPDNKKTTIKKWERITHLMRSYHENDWRQGIIEADILLHELLERVGYEGDSIGEKLKKADRNDFLTLDSAWEAHKMRNRIAHDGTNFALSHSEAERIYHLYEKVFDEFYFI